MKSIGMIAAWAAAVVWAATTAAAGPAIDQDVKQGELRVEMKDGSIVSCPLKHTDVQAKISGFIARVKVKQTFYNPLDEKIEAVYVFPLPHEAAVDDMTMVIGDRRIIGIIKRRAEARAIYEEALARGLTAALLEQERPNIFTQSVGNIKPKQEVVIEISYVDVLKYDMGIYDFHFPMVVGPRYIPGDATSKTPAVPPELQGKTAEVRTPEGVEKPKGDGWSPDTDRVPDASRITPPVLKPGFRNGHDISLAVELDAGVPVRDVQVPQHKATVERDGQAKAKVKLDPGDSIPNKDFILRYAVVGEKPELAVLAHAEPARGGYFMLMVQPKEDERIKQSPPREIFFLVDVSGSQHGQPIAQSKRAMKEFLASSKAGDTFQVVTFSSSARELFEKPQAIDDKALTAAMEFVDKLEGGGGTEMLKGIVKCLDAPADPKRVRIVVMFTDGYIGNEKEIIGEVGRRCGDRIRFWTIGVGSSVNRFLVDGVAKEGGGMSKILGLTEDPKELVSEVMFRIHRAQLASITIDWGGLDVYEMYPAKVPELWVGRPVILFARYRGGGKATIKVNGKVEGEAASFPVTVELPRDRAEHEVIPKVWARKKIEYVMLQDAIEPSPAVAEVVTELALDYRLMSEYTSFVAVDESDAKTMSETARPPRRMLVPVPMPEGVSFAGVFGPQGEEGGEFKKLDALRQDKPAGLANGKARERVLRAPAPGVVLSIPAGPGQPTVGGARHAYAALEKRAVVGTSSGQAGTKGQMMQLSKPAAPGRFLDAEALSVDYSDRLGAGDYDGPRGYGGVTRQLFGAVYAEAQKRAEEAKKALDAGKELAKKADVPGARGQFQFAFLLDSIGMSAGYSNGGTSREALAEMAKLTEKNAALEKRLELVVRRQTLDEALAAVAKAAGLKVTVASGSTEDAKALLRVKELRVAYLDLRGARVREALDWLLSPMRLSWTAKGDEVSVGTARRLGGPWVYDAELIAIPDAKSFEKMNWQEQATVAKEAADAFLAAVRETAPGAVWYAPGQVLVFGDAKTHDAVGRLLADLADPKAKLDDAAGKIHAATAARYAAKKESYEKWLGAVARARVAAALSEHSYTLLADALDGKENAESVAELEEALADPACGELFEKGSFVAVRAAWLLCESARALPKSDALNRLAGTQSARGAVRAALAEAVEKGEKLDPAGFVKSLYGALAAETGELYATKSPEAVLLAKCRFALTTAGREKDALANFSVIARALLGPAEPANAQALARLLDERVQGDDLVLLAALAARRAGADTWGRFRAAAPELLGKQALSGPVVVLVNRLDGVREPARPRQ